MVSKANDDDGYGEILNPRKKERIEEQVDRISGLHDTIIHHILSFVPTIEAARTCLLAKRWRNVWAETPFLDFDDRQFAGREHAFANFVNSVHASHKATTIQRYRLSVQHPNSATLVKWVRFAALKNTKELYISCSGGGLAFEMPCYGSLRDLKLHLEQGILEMPTNGCFSSLEALSLSSVYFDDTIFSVSSPQFPRIRSLKLNDCVQMNHLTVDCPLLEEMEIKRCYGLDWLIVHAERLHSLSVHDSFTYGSTSVEIFAPRLQTFKWLDYIVGNFDIGNFTSLRDAQISLVMDSGLEDTELYVKNAKNFLNHLSCAKNVEVVMASFWGLSIQTKLLEGLSTTSHNLKHLTILVGQDDYVFPGISHLFKSCPNLNTLSIQIYDEEIRGLHLGHPEASALDEGKDWKYRHQPLDQLLEANMCGFKGRGHEIEFVEFLLKNAVVLKRMTILFPTETSQTTLGRSKKDQIIRRVMELEKTSPNVVVTFH